MAKSSDMHACRGDRSSAEGVEELTMDMIPRSIELLRAVQEELESLLTRIKDTSSQDATFHDLVTETSVLFSEYKSLTRENFVATDLGRCELQLKKQHLDSKHLQLQNLLYHKDHLQRSIRALQEHHLPALQKVEGETVRIRLSELVAVQSVDEHRACQRLLEEEREGRQKLHEEFQRVEKARASLSEEIEKLKDTLSATIPKHLEELHDCAMSIFVRARTVDPLNQQGLGNGAAEEQTKALNETGNTPWTSLKPEDLAKLPDPLYTLLGRVWGYLDAVDPEAKRLSVSMVAADEAHGVQVDKDKEGRGGVAMAMQLADDATAPHCPLGVGPHAVCLRLWSPELPGAGPEEVWFYYCPNYKAVLVHTPGDPQALINMLPGDTGLRLQSPTVGAVLGLGEAWQGPRAYQWGQWLAGALPLPARLAGVAPDYSCACVLDRLVVRLRTRRLLASQIAQLCSSPYVPCLDPQADRGLLPELLKGEGTEGWQLVRCVEVFMAQVPQEIFTNAYHEGGPSTEQPMCGEKRADGSGERISAHEAATGPGWERVGARYLELSLCAGKQGANRRAESLKAYVEICSEYPVRPATVRFASTEVGIRKSSSASVHASVPVKYAETEVNAYSEALLGDHANSRDWLLPHQVHRLVVCLNSDGSANVRSGRSKRTSRGTFNQDVHTRLVLPR